MPRSRGLRLGEADGGDLRIGEGHPRHARRSASSAAERAEDHVAGDARLVLAHVREQRAAVAVADRVEPAAVDADGAQLVVDLDGLAGLQPDRLEPEVARRGRRPTATRISSASMVRPSARVAVIGPSEPRRRAAVMATPVTTVDALGGERLGDLLAGERLLPRRAVALRPRRR